MGSSFFILSQQIISVHPKCPKMDKVSDIGHPYFYNFTSLSALYVSGTVFVVRKAENNNNLK